MPAGMVRPRASLAPRLGPAEVAEYLAVAHAITARFRHRIDGGRLRLMYKLDRPAEVVTAAFEDMVASLAQACGCPVLRGTPAGT